MKWGSGYMEHKKIKELITPQVGYMTHVNEIIKNFKIRINRDIPRRQEENLRKLASLFINDFKIDKPVVVNLDIGQGKSMLLLEFIRYICEIDETFSAVIVKRTLQEGGEFCMNVGLNKRHMSKDVIEYWEYFPQDLEELYYGDLENYKEYGYTELTKFPQEELFTARLLRGFNYKDCLEFKDPKEFKLVFGEMPSDYKEYSPVLCSNCSRTCGVKLSRWSVDKHPVVVITHQRLFLSNDLENIIDNITERKVLIIDEKIETKDIGDVLLEQWETILTKLEKLNLTKEIKEDFRRIAEYLNNLQYPNQSDGSIVRISPYDPTYKFDPIVYGMLVKDYEDIKNIVAVEKFLNYGGTTSRSWHKEDKKQFSYIRYINLENYTKYFERTIILDATSVRNGEILDSDYKKSDIVFLDGLHQTPKGKINLYYNPQKTTKSALIYSSNIKTDKEKNKFRDLKGDKKFYLMNVDLLAQEIQDIIKETNEKTLVICYRTIVDKFRNEFKFEEDLKKSIKSLGIDTNLYTVRHFGAATTGLNDYRDYRNIVFIGMLNKGQLYYTNKTIAIESGNSEATALSEYIIDCIQQIGRICVRQGQDANVYILFEDKINLIEELEKHYSLKYQLWTPKHFNGINNATISKKKTCWFAVINELMKLNDGESLSLCNLQDVLKSKFKIDTVYRQIEHPSVEYYMATHAIIYNKKEKCFTRKKIYQR